MLKSIFKTINITIVCATVLLVTMVKHCKPDTKLTFVGVDLGEEPKEKKASKKDNKKETV